MRAISPHANYSIVIKSGKIRRGVDNTGQIVEVVESTPAMLQFEHFAITPEEQAVALEKLNFKGLPEGVNPLTTLGVWDSHRWQQQHGVSDAEREEVERLLREKGEAQNFARFIIVEKARAPKPWPTYDEDEAEDIVALAERLNLVEAVKQYERENQAREDILVALGDAPKEEIIEVSV